MKTDVSHTHINRSLTSALAYRWDTLAALFGAAIPDPDDTISDPE